MSLRQISSFSNQIFKKFNLPPNSNTFSDWRRTCHVSLVKVSWRPKANKTSWRPRATTTWTFDSHMIRSCTFETAANLFASRVRQKIFFYAVMAAKRIQTITEQEIEQLLRDKSSKSTNKATDSAVRTLRNFCKEQNLDKCFHELSKTDLNSLLRKFCNNFVSWYLFYFELGGITKHLMTGPWGNSEICFPSTLNVPLGFASETLGSRANKTHSFPWGQSLGAYSSHRN